MEGVNVRLLLSPSVSDSSGLSHGILARFPVLSIPVGRRPTIGFGHSEEPKMLICSSSLALCFRADANLTRSYTIFAQNNVHKSIQ
jgi:hypothetical protein